MTRRLWLVLALLAAPLAAQDEALAPDGTNASDSNTSCNATVHTTIDDDPDSPGGDWCTADSNNDSWSFTVTLPTPTSGLDTTTDAQAIDVYVRQFDEGQTGVPTIRVDVYDGASCADLHESGTETDITAAGFPAKYTENWTAAGISAAADICFVVACTKSGGSPGARNSCDIDAIEWDVTWSSASPAQAIVIAAE